MSIYFAIELSLREIYLIVYMYIYMHMLIFKR